MASFFKKLILVLNERLNMLLKTYDTALVVSLNRGSKLTGFFLIVTTYFYHTRQYLLCYKFVKNNIFYDQLGGSGLRLAADPGLKV